MDHFAVLGLDDTASAEDAKLAYLRLAKAHHPDKGGDPAHFQRLTEAVKVLGSPATREVYVRWRRAAVRAEELDREQAQAAARLATERLRRLEAIRARPWWVRALRRLGVR